MQSKFSDVTDMGQLYINYPMIESYQHLKSIPDNDYLQRKISVSLQPGKRYKELVSKETVIDTIINFPHKIEDLLKEKYGVFDENACGKCCEGILAISDTTDLEKQLQEILQDLFGY